MYSHIEEEHLAFIRRSLLTQHNQGNDINPHDTIQNIELPASFMSSRKWASEHTADSLALARVYGPPSFFITMTCNPDWPEIKAYLQHGQKPCDAPAILVRAFKLRLQRLLRILRTKFGKAIYIIKVIEFQKRGLPHGHIIMKVCRRSFSFSLQLIFLNYKCHPELPIDEIDRIIKAELPSDNPRLCAKIKKFMTHSKDHLTRETSCCNKDGKCIYHFPHPITPQTWIDDDSRVHYKRSKDEDGWIAPHIPELIDELDCHIYVDIVLTVSIFSYLYKYLHKGPNQTWFHIDHNSENSNLPR